MVPDAAQVSLITDSAVEVTAKISATGTVGMVQPEVGAPGKLLMQYLYPSSSVAPLPGDYVVTSGTVASPGASLYPKGIPIGQVTSVNEQGGFKSVEVSPLADLHSLEYVQVLTYSSGSQAAVAEQRGGQSHARPSAGPRRRSPGRTGRADWGRRMSARAHTDEPGGGGGR